MDFCALHNILREIFHESYAPTESFNAENPENGGTLTSGLPPDNANTANLENGQGRNPTEKVNMARKLFHKYFNN
jgi:hypothetical protein